MYYVFGDRMTIYIDLYFIINYILDISLLIGTSKLLKIHVKMYRYLIGALIGSLSIILLFIKLNNIELILIKLLISLFMIITTFGYRNILKNTFYFYMLSIILGGTMYLLDLNFDYTNNSYYFNYLVLIILSPIIIYVFIKDFIDNKRANMNKYLVEIEYNNEIYKTYGLIDTGNCLKDPYKKRSVILIDYKIDIEKPILVPFKALNSTGFINCFKPDKLIINDKEYNDLLIGISNNNLNLCGCRCILPNNLVEVI